MTKIAMLLAVYLFALALVPCADEGICTKPAETAVLDIHPHNENEEQHQHDSCTALCGCSCCGIITNIQDLTAFVFNIDEVYQPFKIQQFTHRFHGYCFSVWQPPKFGVYS